MESAARRRRATAVAFLLVVVPALAMPEPEARAGMPLRSRPNILLIVTDDQRDTLRYMKATKRIFKRGGRSFRHAYVSDPNCCPSRASILTGRYIHNHGVTNNTESENLDQRTTLQYYLQGLRYKTGVFGKYLNGFSTFRSPPYFSRWAMTDPHPKYYYYGGRWNVDGDRRQINRYSTDFIGARTKRFLNSTESEDKRPWFALVTPNAPHLPAEPEPDYARAPVGRWPGTPAVFEDDRSDKPPFVRDIHHSLSEARLVRKRQIRTLMSVDDLVKDLFKTIDELREDRRTIAIFTSDNGYFWGEHKLRQKWLPYTEAVEVPLYVRYPGVFRPGSVDDRLVSNVDIAPTIMEAVEHEPNTPMDGKSLLDATWTRDHVLIEYGGREDSRFEPIEDWASMRNLSFVYTEYQSGEEPLFTEYYDLEADPWELTNVMGDDVVGNEPPTVALHSAQLKEDRSCIGATCP